MRNVTLPAPMLVAGGVGCLLAGALTGYVLAPHKHSHDTATVHSFNTKTSQLCLSGGSVSDDSGVTDDGYLCGVLRRSNNQAAPRAGQKFRYVVIRTSGTANGEKQHQTVIYGTVVN
ncbi:MAG TPA: hypothetical protein VF426_06275 [Marmoricola sp.]